MTRRAPTINLTAPIGPQLIEGVSEVFAVALEIDELQRQINRDPPATGSISGPEFLRRELQQISLRRRKLMLSVQWQTFSVEDQVAALAWVREHYSKAS